MSQQITAPNRTDLGLVLVVHISASRKTVGWPHVMSDELGFLTAQKARLCHERSALLDYLAEN